MRVRKVISSSAGIAQVASNGRTSTSLQPASARMPRVRSGSARPYGPGVFGMRAGRSRRPLVARAVSVMNGFSAGSRQQTKRRRAASVAAPRRLAKAATGSAKNITPSRETIRSKLAGSKSKVWASPKTKSIGTPAALARSRAARSSGSEMSAPTVRASGPSSRARASVVKPAPQPTSSRALAPAPAASSSGAVRGSKS